MKTALLYSLTGAGWTPTALTLDWVWTGLYLLLVLGFGFVLYQISRERVPTKVGRPIAVNLLANIAFAPLFLVGHRPWLAMIDLLIVLASIIWAMTNIWPLYKWVVATLVPYLFWVATATALQLSITLASR